MIKPMNEHIILIYCNVSFIIYIDIDINKE